MNPANADVLYGLATIRPRFAMRLIPLTRRERFVMFLWRAWDRLIDVLLLAALAICITILKLL